MVFPSSRAVPIHLLAGHRDPSWGRGPGAGWGARGRRRHPAAHYDILPRTSARTLAPSHRPARCTYRARITLPSSTNCAPRLHHHSCWRLSNLVSIPSWWRRSGRARRSAPGRCGPRRVALPARVARCVVAVAHARLGTPRGSGRFGKLGALSVAPLLLFHLGIHVRTTPRRPVALRLSGAWRHRPGRPLLPAGRCSRKYAASISEGPTQPKNAADATFQLEETWQASTPHELIDNTESNICPKYMR